MEEQKQKQEEKQEEEKENHTNFPSTINRIYRGYLF